MLPPTGADAVRAMTSDEMEVRIMDLSRKLAADPNYSQADRDEAAAQVARIEEGIRHQARAHLELGYTKHLAWVATATGHDGDYVPAVYGDIHVCSGMVEYCDLDKPRIMARRAALRAQPDIARLIEEGSRA